MSKKELDSAQNRPRLRLPPRPGPGSSGRPTSGSLSTPGAGRPLLYFQSVFRRHDTFRPHNSLSHPPSCPSGSMLCQGTALQVAEKLYFGGRRGFQAPHKASKISAGFSPGRTFPVNFTRNPEFFRSLFSRAVGANKLARALAPEGMSAAGVAYGFAAGCACASSPWPRSQVSSRLGHWSRAASPLPSPLP